MASQEDNTELFATQAEMDRLAQRQELILSQLDQLQNRVNKLGNNNNNNQTTNGMNGISPINTENLVSSGRNEHSSHSSHSSHHHHHRHRSRGGKMSSKDFSKLNESQYEMLDRLLNVAHKVETLGKSQNVDLPQQSNVNESMGLILEMIDRRLNKVVNKTSFLISMANQSLSDKKPELTPDSVRSQGTPVFHSRPRKLSSAGLEPMHLLPFHNEPKESESAEFWRRINELEYSLNHLKEMLNNKNNITSKEFFNVLSNMKLGLNLQQVLHARHISIITKEMINKETNLVNINKLCEYTMDINKTDRGEHKHEWHHFRRTLIGIERQEGCLRIIYRFDGWPYGQTIRLFHRLDTTKNIVLSNDIASMIHDATKEHIEFQTISYAEKSKHGVGKTTWIKIDKNDPIPLHVERDGWLEVDVWLKTSEFITNKRGKPLPKYA